MSMLHFCEITLVQHRKPWKTLWKVEIRVQARNPGPLGKPWETPWEVRIAVEAQNPGALQT